MPDPAESSGGATNAPSGQSTEPNKPASPPAAPPASAAATVANGPVTEDTLKLKEENEALKRTIKQREQEHASVSDEFKRYKDATEARSTPTPTTIPVKSGKVETEPTPYRFLRRR